MKIAISIFLSLLLLSPIGVKLTIVTWWQENRVMISATQCENRFDESLMCSGKCVLIKVINKYDHQDQESNKGQLTIIMKMGVDVFDNYQDIRTASFMSLEKTRNPIYFTSTHHSVSFNDVLIKPPIA
ncbi:MAG: hypothetical protein IPO45_13885 [Saprospiraceae bacterium]|uniref:hypothetical protein n=1 Tax=Candidatus Brachybacter algidus TaxID=2982024 RepID=UPI001B5C4FF5|nr:hypothetical protein [Candidatus Brachybacter algidus]MBP7304846.1 hypothetical protein [Saprospiraceae bacterium]MBK6371751.1 hypothetical protein [Candidatus Brachybacter algidus]MBK6448912.1 hypothetical protein [Candidatus Brachybacter algidus]MBK8357246.1 hypothetical protein [Candidatus Brachybacter algidus]MBK8843315.1 hypothetical protein [Candidatus Brachybacter algidus]